MSHPYIPNSNDAISLSSINSELGHRTDTEISFADIQVKKIAGIDPATSQMSFSDLYGKAAYWNKTFTNQASGGYSSTTDMIVYGDETLSDYYVDDGYNGFLSSGGDVYRTLYKTYYSTRHSTSGFPSRVVNLDTLYANLDVKAVTDGIILRPRASSYADPPSTDILVDNSEFAYYSFTGSYRDKFTAYSGGSGTRTFSGGIETIEDYIVVNDISTSPSVIRIWKNNNSAITSYATISNVTASALVTLSWDSTDGLSILTSLTDTSAPDSDDWTTTHTVYQESAAGSGSFSASSGLEVSWLNSASLNSNNLFVRNPTYNSNQGRVSVYDHDGSLIKVLDISDVPYAWDGEDLAQTQANSGTGPAFGNKFVANNNYIMIFASGLYFPTQPAFGTRTTSYSSPNLNDNLNYGSYVVRGCWFVFDASDLSYVQTLPPPYYVDMAANENTASSYNANAYPGDDYHENTTCHRGLRYHASPQTDTDIVDYWTTNQKARVAHGSSGAANVFYFTQPYSYSFNAGYEHIKVWHIDNNALSRPTPY
jgi:hypothetical protein